MLLINFDPEIITMIIGWLGPYAFVLRMVCRDLGKYIDKHYFHPFLMQVHKDKRTTFVCEFISASNSKRLAWNMKYAIEYHHDEFLYSLRSFMRRSHHGQRSTWWQIKGIKRVRIILEFKNFRTHHQDMICRAWFKHYNPNMFQLMDDLGLTCEIMQDFLMRKLHKAIMRNKPLFRSCSRDYFNTDISELFIGLSTITGDMITASMRNDQYSWTDIYFHHAFRKHNVNMLQAILQIYDGIRRLSVNTTIQYGVCLDWLIRNGAYRRSYFTEYNYSTIKGLLEDGHIENVYTIIEQSVLSVDEIIDAISNESYADIVTEILRKRYA